MTNFLPTKGARALHWVLKIGNLKHSMAFFENVLGMRVMRHEEFESGCEATCNGPYGGAWSKTMIGYGPEATNFALELTYNYGIDGYEFGNDLQYIAMANPNALIRAAALGYNTVGNVIQGIITNVPLHFSKQPFLFSSFLSSPNLVIFPFLNESTTHMHIHS